MDFKNEEVLNGQTGPSGLALGSGDDMPLVELFSEYFVNENFKIVK